MIKKELIPTNDVYIQFTEEELSQIGAQAGSKFSAELHDDGSIELRPYAKLDIDISQWDRDILERLIGESCERDVSVNEIIEEVLQKYVATD